MICIEDPQFTRDYHDPEKRSIANGITVEFRNGDKLDEVVVEYPIGHSSAATKVFRYWKKNSESISRAVFRPANKRR